MFAVVACIFLAFDFDGAINTKMIKDPERLSIDLSTPLSIRSSFRFPLQSAVSRREVLWGAALIALLPGVGWLLNMGHRIMVVHRMQRGQPPWPAWRDYGNLLRHGLITAGGMVYYSLPGLIIAYAAWSLRCASLGLVAGVFLLGATVAIPGYMSHYCQKFDLAEIYNPFRALRRCMQGGAAYWRAWLITLTALTISFIGFLAFGVGFLVTSVWFWQAAGFSFASVFTQRFGLTIEGISIDNSADSRKPHPKTEY
jgi:hypothetical protein